MTFSFRSDLAPLEESASFWYRMALLDIQTSLADYMAEVDYESESAKVINDIFGACSNRWSAMYEEEERSRDLAWGNRIT